METILLNIQAKIESAGIKYVDEDWGQLNLFPGDTPVQFPCCLFDITDGNFENIGQDRRLTPKERQMGRFSVELCIANTKLSNTSGRAPISQKLGAWSIHSVIRSVHDQLQGFSPDENCSKLNRKSYKKIRRDDGIQEYRIVYDFEASNV
ncbi:hypothetical protein EIB75_10705 [Epilithonimonas vandammei]|uniref:DUF3168 domain-containing protein n=1 Tax=Epilithonimonas vandammei TaxID=2487072 RepID=A0A3G8Z958_9FLAO|nr:hypothetical protein [Epilithonimonas vandammei]AZI53889.1 hypothetical protein EIB75_00845 [Epilithonimonas vandammei]AZI55692.1 hypothetical protein EIB75_10705 [Epilithonimonas vandammei]